MTSSVDEKQSKLLRQNSREHVYKLGKDRAAQALQAVLPPRVQQIVVSLVEDKDREKTPEKMSPRKHKRD